MRPAPDDGTNEPSSNPLYDWRVDTLLVSLAEAPDIDYQFNTSSISVAWEPFEDVGSGIARVAYCLGSRQFLCDIFPWTTQAWQAKTYVDYAAISGLNITAGTVVYATITAINNVGLVSMIASDGLYVDDRGPQVPHVYDTGKYFMYPDAVVGSGKIVYRPAVDINCDTEGAGVGAAWADASSPGGVLYYEWAVGTAPNGTEILYWTVVGDALAVFNASVYVPTGGPYFASVRATSVTGLRAYGFSNGVTIINEEDATQNMVCFRHLEPPTAVGVSIAQQQLGFSGTRS